MDNPGAYPIDSNTTVGQWRLTYGDTQSTAYDPVVPGVQNFTFYSDAEIEQFLIQGNGSINAAIGYAYMQASGAAARESKTIADYDLRVGLEKRAEDLRKTAQFYFDRAVIDGDGADEFFDIIELDPEWVDVVEGETQPFIWWGR